MHYLQQNKVNKLIYLEFLRICSIILVIFNHTGWRGYFLYSIAESSVFYPVYFFCSIACAVDVPLFWMISGALLIQKEESIHVLYKKRILNTVLTLVVFSFIQYLFWVSKGQTFYILDFLKKLYTSKMATAYWYLYAYIGVLLVLPFIRKMARHMDRKEYLYLFGLSLAISGILPMVQYLFWRNQIVINGNLTRNIFSASIVYFMAGHYFGNVIGKEELSGKKAILYMVLGFMAIVISCFMTKYMTNITGKTGEGDAQTFYGNLICIPTYVIFYLARYL